MSDIGREMIEGMQELTEALENGDGVSDQFTVRSITLDLEPNDYTASMVQETRALLNVSQAVFAKFLGVSTKTVSSWEQGANPVNGAATRLMDEIRFDPDHWRSRLLEIGRPKTSV